MIPLVSRTTYVPTNIGAATSSINTAEVLASILGLEMIPATQNRIIVQDSKTARNLYIFARDPDATTTHRQRIRLRMATISKSLATRLADLTKQFPTSPLTTAERIPIQDILHTIVQVDTATCTESDPKQGDYHAHAPSIRSPSHQLTNDGRPIKGTQPIPCFSLAHANF